MNPIPTLPLNPPVRTIAKAVTILADNRLGNNAQRLDPGVIVVQAVLAVLAVADRRRLGVLRHPGDRHPGDSAWATWTMKKK